MTSQNKIFTLKTIFAVIFGYFISYKLSTGLPNFFALHGGEKLMFADMFFMVFSVMWLLFIYLSNLKINFIFTTIFMMLAVAL